MSSSKILCKACTEPILEDSDGFTCKGECNSVFHFHCGGFTERDFRRLTVDKKQEWTCVQCSKTQENPTKIKSATSPDILEDILQQNKDLKELITNRFNDLTRSIKFSSEIIQELKNSITELQNANKTLQAKNEQLTRENAEIKKEMNELIEAVIELKQYSRRSNFEINNSPECENEDIQQAISQIDNVANTNISENLITAHRVPSFNKDKPKPIIVQVKSKSVRDELLKKLRNRKLSTCEVNSRFTEMPVYFNEHLTPELKHLFYLSRKAKSEKGFKFCWVRDGKIFLRKDESSKIIRVKSSQDLNTPSN
nr:uncharacterized protein LOC110282482 [Parasteatoda tepidariorum]